MAPKGCAIWVVEISTARARGFTTVMRMRWRSANAKGSERCAAEESDFPRRKPAQRRCRRRAREPTATSSNESMRMRRATSVAEFTRDPAKSSMYLAHREAADEAASGARIVGREGRHAPNRDACKGLGVDVSSVGGRRRSSKKRGAQRGTDGLEHGANGCGGTDRRDGGGAPETGQPSLRPRR